MRIEFLRSSIWSRMHHEMGENEEGMPQLQEKDDQGADKEDLPEFDAPCGGGYERN